VDPNLLNAVFRFESRACGPHGFPLSLFFPACAEGFPAGGSIFPKSRLNNRMRPVTLSDNHQFGRDCPGKFLGKFSNYSWNIGFCRFITSPELAAVGLP
jgi:hypothetical protein